MEQKEVWKEIPGYEGFYEVSDCGNVRSIPRQYKTNTKVFKSTKYVNRKFTTDPWGYYVLGLSKNGEERKFRVHQLVAMAFLGHKLCHMKLVIDHKDRNKKNNHVDNLRIVSVRENNLNKGKDGHTSEYVGVYKNSNNNWTAGIGLNGKNYNLFSRAKNQDEAKEIFTKAIENVHNFNGNIEDFRILIGIEPPEYNNFYYDKSRNKFVSEITINRTSIFLKRFDVKSEAVTMTEIAKSIRQEFDGDKAKFRNKVKELYANTEKN